MKAFIQTGYGSADVISPAQLDTPSPGPGEVLVRVCAVSLAAGDRFMMRGKPFPARLAIGFPKPKPDHVVGLDFAGVITAVGPGVTELRVADEVYGECHGSCAEFARADVRRIAAKPNALTFQEAASVPTSACTALIALRDHGKVHAGSRVLINGASGGVGTFAVQIAKALGAEVTGVCSARNAEMVAALGADSVIDYSKEDFTQGSARYDVILDNVASHTLAQTRRALAPGGIHLPSSGHAGMGWIIAAALTAPFVKQQGAPFVAINNTADLSALADLIDAGKVRPVIDRVYSFEETRDAFRYVDEAHVSSKTVISVDSECS
ncbi:MAG: NAD(P)-dependent alcohol dehydrogenase [Coriobacteriia bacterium]|nr:NAD(P)-dependent alcohol dehydrogenase [Coriobacteriia bacterium]